MQKQINTRGDFLETLSDIFFFKLRYKSDLNK